MIQAYREDAAQTILEKLENTTNKKENCCVYQAPRVEITYPQLTRVMEETRKVLPHP